MKYNNNRLKRIIYRSLVRGLSLGMTVLLLFASGSLFGQYFGRNKPRYKAFDFKVLHTPHFDIYHYLRDKDVHKEVADWTEHWHTMHSIVWKDTLVHNPFVLYSDHGDFQQTNVIGGRISTGTGGVTEALKNRMVLPLTFTKAQTHHVIGHEMVHAFQYNAILHGDSTSLQSLQNLPLFMVEGLAEYLSIGKQDAHTAIWMRDAILNDNIPSLNDLYKPKYFPYRWGQVFWTFMTGMFGDDVIEPFFMSTAKYGFDQAIDSICHVDPDTLSNIWVRTLKKYYAPYVGDGRERPIGKRILDDKNAGYLNIAPSLSPNGKYLIFVSEKDLFTTDLYLANARTGKIIRKITSSTKGGHFDALSYIESNGTWSPNSKEFAYVAYRRGHNVLIIKQVKNGKTKAVFNLPGVPAFSNPTWLADGKTIVVSGLVEGRTDLYAFDIKKKRVTRLTDTPYSEILPNSSPDGKYIVFSTDENSVRALRSDGKWKFNIATLRLADGAVTPINVFKEANNLNPVYDHEGNILFLSDRDGYRNLYKYTPTTRDLIQLTDFLTGITGITPYSPAITASKRRDRVLYTHFYDGKYIIYKSRQKDLLHKPVDPEDVNQKPAILPFPNPKRSFVTQNLRNIEKLPPLDTTLLTETKYRPRLQLDYVSAAAVSGIGLGYGSTVPVAGGGLFLLFGDQLGDHKIISNLGLNGEIYDINGNITYLNLKHRFGWGIGLSHYPYRTGFLEAGYKERVDNFGQRIPTYEEELNIIRIFSDNLNVIGQYPFSVNHRVEANVGYTYRYFRWDTINNIYSQDGLQYFGQERGKKKVPSDELVLGNFVIRKEGYANAGMAFVGDDSYFGMASPMAGYRYRVGFSKYFGGLDYNTGILDFRKYYWRKPISLAFRFMHYAIFGKDERRFYPIFLGQMGLVRGLPFNRLEDIQQRYDLTPENLSGSKLFLSGLELRFPFTGIERLALISSRYFFSEIALFVDGGIAFYSYKDILDAGSFPQYAPKPVFTTGVSTRINLFGSIILEPYVSWVIHKNSTAYFGLNFIPGW